MAGTLKAWGGIIAVVALVAAAGYGLYMGAQNRGDAQVHVDGVVLPYVAANVAGEHAAARERYTTPDWKVRHTLDELAGSYRIARDEYGGVTGFRLHNTQTEYAPGGEEALNVRGFLQLGDGNELPVTFMLIETGNGAWLIERSWTRGSGGHPGPW